MLKKHMWSPEQWLRITVFDEQKMRERKIEKDKQTNRETHFECITVDGVDGSVCRSVLCVESSLFV